MSNKDLFKEAIADAKAVREAALANAKVALEEALAPKIQSMFTAKLQEMDNDEMDEVKHKDEEKMKEGFYPSETSDKIQDRYRATGATLEEGEDELEEDFDLSEILAELSEEKEKELDEAKKEDKEDVKEAKDKEEMDEAKKDDKKDKMDEAEEAEAEEEESESEDKITDLTVDELKDIIKDIISAEMGGGEEMAADMDMDMGGEEEMAVDVDAEEGDMEVAEEYSEDKEDLEEFDLEELLAELDSLDEADDKEDVKEIFGFGKKKPEDSKENSSKPSCPEGQAKWSDGKCYPVEQAGYQDLGKIPRLENGTIIIANDIWSMEEGKKVSKKDKEDKDEMKEALDTIETLRNELNEVNLLNAKLLYVNKIFKAKNLTESQKLKVIAQFDKATTTAEAKTIFESMNNAIEKSKKSIVKESLGFASKAAGVAPKKPIVEIDATMSRWQMLAGITKF